MKLEEAMAMGILRKIVEQPDKFPAPLRAYARNIDHILTNDNDGFGWPATLSGLAKIIAEHADELQAICTEKEL